MSWISRVQYGTITIAAGASSGTDTLANAVNTAKTFANYEGWRTTDTSLVVAEDLPRVDLQDSTTVRARTDTINASTARTVPYMVVEGNTYIDSVEQFSIIMTGSISKTATLAASVDTSRSWVLHGGSSSSSSNNDWNYCQARVSLTNTSTVTADRNSSFSGGCTVNGAVIQAAAGVVNSIQTVLITITNTNSQIDATVTAVNDSRAILFWNGWQLNAFSNNEYRTHPKLVRTSTTNVRASRGGTSADTPQVAGTLVDFNAGYCTRRVASTNVIATGATTQDTTISTANREKSFISWLGFSATNAAGSANGAIAFPTVAFNDTNTVRSQRGASDATIAITNSWEVCECNDLSLGALTITGYAPYIREAQPVGVLTFTLNNLNLPNALVPLGALAITSYAPTENSLNRISLGTMALALLDPHARTRPGYVENQPSKTFTGTEIGV